jgi:hypothetical protein
VVCSSRSAQDFRKPLWVFSRWIWGVPFYPLAVASDWQWSKELGTDRQSCCDADEFSSGPRQQPSAELPPNFFALLQSIGCTATVRTNLEPETRAESGPRGQIDDVRSVSGRHLFVRPSPENFDLECSCSPFSIDLEGMNPNHPSQGPGAAGGQTLSRIQCRCSGVSHFLQTRAPEFPRTQAGVSRLFHSRNVLADKLRTHPKFGDIAQLR